MKKATATKLGIYSTYSQRSSRHFLAHCSSFCKPLKKIQKVVRPNRSPRQKWPPLRTKNGNFSIVFSVQGAGGSPEIRRRGWVNKKLEVQVGQFLPGWKCLVSRGIVVQEQDSLGELPAAFFHQNVLQLHRQRWLILRVESLAFLKIINDEDAVLVPKNRGKNISRGFLHSEYFGAGCATMPPLHWLLLCLKSIVI